MADMISSFPQEILHYILSFLPTKQVVATSVLSNRWNLLSRSVLSFDFYHRDGNYDDDIDKEAYNHFLHSVSSFLLWRDRDQPLHRFSLKLFSMFYDPITIQPWIKAAISCSVQHIHFNLERGNVLPSVVFSCKTLEVLKLKNLTVKDVFFVDLPLLKILHLDSVSFYKDVDLSQILSGSPNLQDLEVKSTRLSFDERFNRLFKLVEENGHLVPLQIVVRLDLLCQEDLVGDFQNLVHLELNPLYVKNWFEVLEVLQRCPKLQSLVIDMHKGIFYSYYEGHEGALSSYPEPVPECISLHLKTCSIKTYEGSMDEFLFARYIMQNAKNLRSMKIKICVAENSLEKKLMRQLSSCMKISNVCTLSFE